MTTAGSLENQELVSQGKNLSVQRCAGPKSLPNRRKERANDREHGVSKLSREPFKFNLLNENRVFSRDRSPIQASQPTFSQKLSRLSAFSGV
jgi:ribosomal protein S10